MTQNEIAQILEAINDLGLKINARLDAVEARLDKIEARMDGLESRMDGLESRMDALERRMDALERRMDKLEKRLDKVESALLLVEQRLSDVEKTLRNVVVEVIDHRVNISTLVTQENFTEFRSLNLKFHDDTKGALQRLEHEIASLIEYHKRTEDRVTVLEKA